MSCGVVGRYIDMLKMQKDREPGSARHGNFINYYSFNPPDRRLSLIPKSMLSDIGKICKQQHIYALDIGCNSGVSGKYWAIKE